MAGRVHPWLLTGTGSTIVSSELQGPLLDFGAQLTGTPFSREVTISNMGRRPAQLAWSCSLPVDETKKGARGKSASSGEVQHRASWMWPGTVMMAGCWCDGRNHAEVLYASAPAAGCCCCCCCQSPMVQLCMPSSHHCTVPFSPLSRMCVLLCRAGQGCRRQGSSRGTALRVHHHP